jgi:hypothetical protein
MKNKNIEFLIKHRERLNVRHFAASAGVNEGVFSLIMNDREDSAGYKRSLTPEQNQKLEAEIKKLRR